jgi:hypothetical protein
MVCCGKKIFIALKNLKEILQKKNKEKSLKYLIIRDGDSITF